jgi:hypothetical protein
MPLWYHRRMSALSPTPAVVKAYGDPPPTSASSPRYETFEDFVVAFMTQARRRPGNNDDDLDLIDRVDAEQLLHAYRTGHDPLVIAADFCEHFPERAKQHQTYEAYLSAVLAELKPFFSDGAMVEKWISVIKQDRIVDGYEVGVHPRVIAGFYKALLGSSVMSTQLR